MNMFFDFWEFIEYVSPEEGFSNECEKYLSTLEEEDNRYITSIRGGKGTGKTTALLAYMLYYSIKYRNQKMIFISSDVSGYNNAYYRVLDMIETMLENADFSGSFSYIGTGDRNGVTIRLYNGSEIYFTSPADPFKDAGIKEYTLIAMDEPVFGGDSVFNKVVQSALSKTAIIYSCEPDAKNGKSVVDDPVSKILVHKDEKNGNKVKTIYRKTRKSEPKKYIHVN